MKPKQLLIEQFLSCYNEPNWFVPFMTTIDGLTAEKKLPGMMTAQTTQYGN